MLAEQGHPYLLLILGDASEDQRASLSTAGIPFVVLPERPAFDLTSHGYVEAGTLRERLPMPVMLDRGEIAADAVDEAVLSGIPASAIVTVDGEPVAHDGALEISSAMPATYHVHVECWPHLPFAADITAS
ncbi:hypothetical protein [Kaistia adipata]|uniref:hypothetical protein n=1 Tax=Kaistia adipata TaxID=166954 RepID=UPI0004296769|nr:hypothetical protein [Kaistia adipata]